VRAAVEVKKGLENPRRVHHGGRKSLFGSRGVHGESDMECVEGFGKNYSEETKMGSEGFSDPFEVGDGFA
jgi:hypothetical protein